LKAWEKGGKGEQTCCQPEPDEQRLNPHATRLLLNFPPTSRNLPTSTQLSRKYQRALCSANPREWTLAPPVMTERPLSYGLYLPSPVPGPSRWRRGSAPRRRTPGRHGCAAAPTRTLQQSAATCETYHCSKLQIVKGPMEEPTLLTALLCEKARGCTPTWMTTLQERTVAVPGEDSNTPVTSKPGHTTSRRQYNPKHSPRSVAWRPPATRMKRTTADSGAPSTPVTA